MSDAFHRRLGRIAVKLVLAALIVAASVAIAWLTWHALEIMERLARVAP